jgi:hypothetical protein
MLTQGDPDESDRLEWTEAGQDPFGDEVLDEGAAMEARFAAEDNLDLA